MGELWSSIGRRSTESVPEPFLAAMPPRGAPGGGGGRGGGGAARPRLSVGGGGREPAPPLLHPAQRPPELLREPRPRPARVLAQGAPEPRPIGGPLLLHRSCLAPPPCSDCAPPCTERAYGGPATNASRGTMRVDRGGCRCRGAAQPAP